MGNGRYTPWAPSLSEPAHASRTYLVFFRGYWYGVFLERKFEVIGKRKFVGIINTRKRKTQFFDKVLVKVFQNLAGLGTESRSVKAKPPFLPYTVDNYNLTC